MKKSDSAKITKNYNLKDYTILVPTMLPIHFNMIISVLKPYGYKIEQLGAEEFFDINYGLKYVHNDMCYPATVVIAQFIEALESGKYDTEKVALMITQTGGGCRASNYISLLRKALERAGYNNIPVLSVSLNFGKLDENTFSLSLPMLLKIAYAVLYADLIMLLKNQCLPYEVQKGETEKKVEYISQKLSKELSEAKLPSYKTVRQNYYYILNEFSLIKRNLEKKPKVGIVGEIFVKFSPVGNNRLEEFLIKEGAEVVMPGLFDFALYCVYNQLMDKELYGTNKLKAAFIRPVYKALIKKQTELALIITQNYPHFTPPALFDETKNLVKGYISHGMKMGEGWLLTAEMLELINSGAGNIVCVQPFGCLPNHIAGKGMMKKLKEKNKNVNIVAIDYDPGASKVNQENRIKLMLSNSKKIDENQNKAPNNINDIFEKIEKMSL